MAFQTVAVPASLANKPRSQNDGFVKYTVKNCHLLGRVLVTASGVCTWTADADDSIPVGEEDMNLMAVAVFPLGNAQLQLIVAGSKGGSGTVNGYATMAALSTYASAFLFTGGKGWNSVSNVTCVGGTANDLVDVYAVPDPDQFTNLAYMRSFEYSAGEHMQPVADRYDPAATFVRIRQNPTFSFGKDYVTFDDFGKLRGVEVTIMVEIRPNGLSGIKEYVILPKAGVSAEVSAPDNAMLVSTATGFEQKLLIYSPGA